MIYIAAVALLIACIGLYRESRRIGLFLTFLDVLTTAVLGLIAGIAIGLGARIGMWTIPFFNGTSPNITVSGTVQVVLVFSLFGIGLALIYEFFVRSIVRKHGFFFGLAVSICCWYPLAEAGAQQLTFSPDLFALVTVSGVIIAAMFIPYAMILERLLRFRDDRILSPVQASRLT